MSTTPSPCSTALAGDLVEVIGSRSVKRPSDASDEQNFSGELLNGELNALTRQRRCAVTLTVRKSVSGTTTAVRLANGDALASGGSGNLVGGISLPGLRGELEQQMITRRETIAALGSLLGRKYGPVDRLDYDSLTTLGLSTVPPLMNKVTVGGYEGAGDCPPFTLTRAAAEPPHTGKKQSLDGAWWEYVKEQAITPQMFGALGGGGNDQPGMQAFFDYCRDRRVGQAAVTGDFRFESRLLWGNPTIDFATKAMFFNATFTGDFVSTGELVRVAGFHIGQAHGHLRLTSGGPAYANRKIYDGLVIETSSRPNFNLLIETYGFKRWGVRIVGPGNLGRVESLRQQYCGSGRGFNVQIPDGAFTSNTQNGPSASTHQRSVLGGVTIPAELAVDDFVIINDIGHRVTGIDADAGIMEVHPWVVGSSGSIVWAIGGGLSEEGPNTNVWQFGVVNTSVCGTGLRRASSNPGNISAFHTASSVIGISVGRSITANFTGGSINECYIEGGAHNIEYLEATVAPVSTAMNTTGAPDPAKFQAMSANNGLDYHSNRRPIRAEVRFAGNTVRGLNSPKNGGGVNHTLTLGDRKRQIYGNSRTLTLNDSAAIDSNFGINLLEWSNHGSGTRGEPTGTITVNAGPGTTVNGSSSIAYSGFNGPVEFLAYRIDGATPNWIVSPVSGMAPRGSVSATPEFVGQLAVIAGVGYMATGTNSPADWKQITN